MDVLSTAEEFAAEHSTKPATMASCTLKYRRLAAQQAALRRLAMLVARGVEPSEVFGAVAEEMRRCVNAFRPPGCGGTRRGGEFTLLGVATDPTALAKWPVGTRTPIDGNTIAAKVQRTGRPARIDSYDNVAGSTAARAPRGGCARGGGSACHRRWTGMGPGRCRVGGTRPDAGRHRGPHQQLRRTCCDGPGGRTSGRADATAAG